MAIFHIKNLKPIWQKNIQQGYWVLSYLQCEKGFFTFPRLVFQAQCLYLSLKVLKMEQGKAIFYMNNLTAIRQKNTRHGSQVFSDLQVDQGSFPFPRPVSEAQFLYFSLKELNRHRRRVFFMLKSWNPAGKKHPARLPSFLSPPEWERLLYFSKACFSIPVSLF